MPEGTRSKGRGLLPFKKGPFITAIKAHVPLVAVCISNYVGKIHLNRWHSGTILMEILPAFSTDGLDVQDANTLKERVFSQMKETIDRLDKEVASGVNFP